MLDAALLARGAETAVRQCLAVGAADRVLVFTDDATLRIGGALADAARSLGATVEVLRLEELGPRPLTALPEGLEARLRAFGPTVSLFAAQGRPGEIRFRIPLGHLLSQELRTRHGHMIGIDERLMGSGMQVDYDEVAALTRRVHERLRGAREIRARNPDGTDLVARFDPDGDVRWVPWTGLLHRQGDWGNLPEGEVFTCPITVDGVLTARLVGDYFARRFGLLETPLRIELVDGHAVSVQHPDAELRDAFWRHLSDARNGTRVGEFAIGTNRGLREATGNLLQDEKMPGLHVAFGDPYGHFTGAPWSSDIHLDVIPFRIDLDVDGAPLLSDGAFVGGAG